MKWLVRLFNGNMHATELCSTYVHIYICISTYIHTYICTPVHPCINRYIYIHLHNMGCPFSSVWASSCPVADIEACPVVEKENAPSRSQLLSTSAATRWYDIVTAVHVAPRVLCTDITQKNPRRRLQLWMDHTQYSFCFSPQQATFGLERS